ncbi:MULTISPECIES: DivIVA domain-containing protein [unclassified Microbacterium]|uniref:DivIVA domain-containing protein n=1 Tax=unclassified Microbacterium TaxID=2609290 RepID=UPI00214B0982|nr:MULTISPECIES: DivIVA domain-containing protein [unclassified Microbacterium]MCR2809413.1 DivIVA domain-containing protein [Microbacterium sp. zg.B185]WIM20550.1 DivIVA domain-containing protein [Microbacterium sp. zg-B185]
MTTSDTATITFAETHGSVKGYEKRAVDAFLLRARNAFERYGDEADQMTSADVRRVAFPIVRHGYVISAVDDALGRIEDAFAAREREAAVADGGVHAWVGQTRETAQVVLDRLSRPKGRRFDRVGGLRYGYRIDEVDLVADKLARYLETGEALSVEQVRGVAFRMQRGGYREAQVDAVLDAVIEVILAVA